MKKRPLHSRALKEVERQKKDAKRELHLARKSGSPAEVVHSLATQQVEESVKCTLANKRGEGSKGKVSQGFQTVCQGNSGRWAGPGGTLVWG